MPAEPIDMGEVARRNLEQMQLRAKYLHLFAPQMERLEAKIVDLEARNANLLTRLHDAERKVTRLEAMAEYETRKKGRRSKGSGVKRGQRNRVVYWVTATLTSTADATLLGETLWQERHPGADVSGIKITTYAVEDSTLKLVTDHVVVGGSPSDIWRDDTTGGMGLLNRVSQRLGVEVVDVKCVQHLRERVEDAEMPSDGS